VIAITQGDSSGVGPEIILRAWVRGELPDDFVVVGDFAVMDFCNRHLRLGLPLQRITRPEDFDRRVVNVVDLGLMTEAGIAIGQISKESGAAALLYVAHATQLALARRVRAIVTMPINKEATRLSHPNFCGHTEYIAALCGTTDCTMMLVSEKLIVTHVSTHVSLRDAIAAVSTARVASVIRLTHQTVQKIRPRCAIAVCGLNPHAGENGAFGSEDQAEIAPAVQQTRQDGIDVEGPFPPDTVFLQAVNGRYDAVVCMYHDQGHIPLKLLDFEGGINVTVGLPIIRTSVDHGTAFDIAYQGVAFTRSLRDACALAVQMTGTHDGR